MLDRHAQLRKGPLTMLVGFMLVGLVPVLVKTLRTVGWPAAHTVVARFAIACLCLGAIVVAQRRWFTANNKPLLVLRGVLGAVAVLLFFASVQLAGAGIGTLLNYTHPLWANVLAALVLKQRPVPSFWLLLLVALLGVYLVIDQRISELQLGELCGIASAVFAGGAVLCIKQLRETDDSLIIIWSFSALGLLFALPVAVWQTSDLEALPWGQPLGWLLLVLTGAFSFLGHIFFTRGYKHTTLQLGSVLALTVPVIAVVSGFLLLDEHLSPTFLLGAGLILGSSGVLGVLESRQASSRRARILRDKQGLG